MPLDMTRSDHRFPRRIVLSMSTVLVTNCEAFGDDQTNSFFKSISPKVIDLIDDIDPAMYKKSIKEFILQLNQYSDQMGTKSEYFSTLWLINSHTGNLSPTAAFFAFKLTR